MRRLFNSPQFVLLLFFGAVGFLAFNLGPILWPQSATRAEAVPPVDFEEPAIESIDVSRTEQKTGSGLNAPHARIPDIGWLDQPLRNPFRFGETALIGKEAEALSQNGLPIVAE